MTTAFDPKNELTYKFASPEKIVEIDGIQFFDLWGTPEGEHKKFITEKDFVNDINSLWEILRPNYKNKQDYINNRIKNYLLCCKDLTIKKSDLTINGYNFTIAQKEMMKYLSQEEKEKLTDIILNHFKNKQQKYRLKQDIFDNLAGKIDNYLFADLCYAQDSEKENEIMYEYYSGFDCIESKEELEEILNNEYLNLYPDLKKEVREDLLQLNF